MKNKSRLLALILSTIMVVAGAASAVSFAETSTQEMTVSKTAHWTTPGEELEIDISENTTAVTKKTPKILFLGTLCKEHSMDANAVNQALLASAKYGDVDYHIFKRKYNDSSKTLGDDYIKTGKITKGTTSVDISLPELDTGYHASLYDFAKVLKEVSTNSNLNNYYDFIVLEFDGMRLGHFSMSKYPTDEDKANLNAAAAIMKEYYKAGKVAWVIPDVEEESLYYDASGNRSYVPNTYIYNDYFFDNNDGYFTKAKTTVRETLKLLAPEDLVDGAVTGVLGSQTNLIKRTNPAKDSDRIWVYYDDASEVRVFLDEKIGNHISMHDIVVDGLNVTSVKGQYYDYATSTWTDIPANRTRSDGGWSTNTSLPTQLSYKLTTNTNVTTPTDVTTTIQADFNLSDIYSGFDYGDAHSVQLVITCEVETAKLQEIYVYNDTTDQYDLVTNEGKAEIDIIGGGETTRKEADPPYVETPPVTVSYQYIPTTISGTPPATETIIPGTKYKPVSPTNIQGYKFEGWYEDELCTDPFLDATSYETGKVIATNTTIYGKWSPADTAYTVEHYLQNLNDNNYTLKATESNIGKTATYTNAVAKSTASGDFYGYTAQTFTQEIIKPDGTTVVKIYYDRNVKAVRYKYDSTPNGATALTSPTNYKYGASVTVAPAATAPGYDFNGWRSSDTNITSGSFTMPNKDVEIIGSWTEHTATLKYDANGGVKPSDKLGDVTLKYSQATNVAADIPTRTGYIFMGWAKTSTATNADFAAGDAYKAAKVEPADYARTLYAVWEYGTDIEKTASETDVTTGDSLTYAIKLTNTSADKMTYTVEDTLDDNLQLKSVKLGSTTLASGTNYTLEGRKLTVPMVEVPAKSGAINGVQTVYVEVIVKTLTSNTNIGNTATAKDGQGVTLTGTATDIPGYPTWKLTYEYVAPSPKNAVTPTDINKYTAANNKAIVATQTDVPGWTFLGWYTDKACSADKKVAAGSKLTLTGSTTLYGKWKFDVVPTKTVNASESITAGEDLTYTITVQNDSANDVANYVISDVLDDRLIYKSSTFKNQDGSTATGSVATSTDVETGREKITASGVAIPAGKHVALAITVMVDPELTAANAEKKLNNEATVDPNTGDSVVKASATSITPQPRTIAVKYEYRKASDTDVLPYGVALPASVTNLKYGDSYTTEPKQSAQGWTFTGWCYRNKAGEEITLNDGADLTLDSNIADLYDADLDKLKDKKTVTLYGSWTYDLSMTKAVSTTTDIKGGDDLEYTIVVQNASKSTVTDFKITDNLDENLTYVQGTLAWSAGGTAPGEINAAAKASGTNITASGLTIPAAAEGKAGTLTLVIKAKVAPNVTEAKTINNTAIGTPKRHEGDKGDPELEAKAPPVTINPRGISIAYEYVGEYRPTGSNIPVEEGTFAYGSNYTIQGKTAADSPLTYDEWWDFSGWYQNEGLSGAVASGTNALTSGNFGSLASNSNIKLYGKWTPVRKYELAKSATYSGENAAGKYIFTGEVLAYKVVVTNSNLEAPATITIKDELPAGLVVQAGTINNGGSFATGSNIITWKDVTVPAGQSVELTYNASISTELASVTNLTNKAYVSKSDGEDYDGEGSEENKPGTVTLYGMPTVSPSVQSTWSDGWDAHASDTNFIKLYGKVDETASLVNDEIELTKDASGWTERLPKFTEDGKAIKYYFTEYRPAAGLVGEVELGDGSEYDRYETSGNYKLAYATNEEIFASTISHTYQIVPDDLRVSKEAFVQKSESEEATITDVEKGDVYSYRLTVENTRSDVGVENVLIVDEVPAGLTIGDIATDSNFEVAVDGQKVSWTIKKLAASGKETLIIPVSVSDERDAVEFDNIAKITKLGDTIVTETNIPKSNVVKTIIRNFTVSKTWNSYNKESGKADTEMTDTSAQPSVTVTLYRQIEGEDLETVGSAELKPGAWTHKWTKLPMYKDGKLYIYTVAEEGVDGYDGQTPSYGTTGDYGNTSASITNLQQSRTVSYAFIAGGGPPKGVSAPTSDVAAYGEKYKAKDLMSADGYDFDGWFTDPEGSVKYVDGTAIDESNTKDGVLMLYGKWTPKTYKITYELDGGVITGGTNPTTYTPDDDDITLINPTREGYKFLGWTGTELSSESLNVVIPSGSYGDRAYTAKWEPLNYDIRYDKPKEGPYNEKNPQFTEPTTETYPRYTKLIVDPNGGSWTHEGKTYVTPAEFILTQDINVEKPVRDHYVFLGWDRFVLDDGATIKLVARWTPDDIGTKENEPDKPDNVPDIYQKKVTFKIQHGEWEDATVEDIVVVVNLLDANGKLDPNGSATIKIPEGMRPDEGFSPENGEWDEEPVIVVSGTGELVYLYSYKPEYEFKPVDGDDESTEKVKVEIGQKVRVNPNGGKWKHNGITHFRTTTIVIEENTVIEDATRRGYKFLGWSTSIGKDGIVTLTAQWKALGAKTGDSNGNDLNNYLFTGMFALILAALVMLWRRNGGVGGDGGADGFGGAGGGLKLQLESVGAGLSEGVESLKSNLKSKAAKKAKATTAPTRQVATQMQPVQQKMAKPEPIKAVQKENKPYMGWFDSNEDYRIVEVEPVVEHKAEVKPDLPDVIEGKEFVIRIK